MEEVATERKPAMPNRRSTHRTKVGSDKSVSRLRGLIDKPSTIRLTVHAGEKGSYMAFLGIR